MRGIRFVALLAAIAAAITLPGCFGPLSPDRAAQKAEDFASDMEQLADAVGNLDYKRSRLVVRNAQTNEIVREVTDQDEIERVISPLSGANGLAEAPSEPAEYVIEVWQPETVKAGQDENDVEETKVLELTVYEGSSVVTLEVSPIGFRLDLDAAGGVADGLRALAG